MTQGVELVGLDKLSARLERIGGMVADNVAKEVAAGALAIQNEMRKSVAKGPHTGRLYPRGKGGMHQASAPGEAPQTDSGNLVSHINHVFVNRFTADVGVFGVPYAHRLEFGGKDSRGVYIAPRPYQRQAIKKLAPSIISNVTKALKEALGGR